MYDLIIRDATIVRSTGRLVADVAIKDGKIAFVGSNPLKRSREELSAIGKFLIPGVIDGDVTLEAPGADLADLWASESRAAAAKGVTTMIHRSSSPTSAAAVKKALKAAGDSVVSAGAWAVAGDADAAALDKLVASGKAVGISATVTDGGMDMDTLRALHAATDALLGVLVEDPAMVAEARERLSNEAAPLHDDVHSPKATLAAAEQLLELVRDSDRPVHIHQLTTALELNLFDPYRDDIPLTSGITPLHLFLSTDSAEQEGGLLKHDPPVRPELDRRALWAAIKRGRVDLFSSGHVPLSREDKGADYWSAPSGVPGADSFLPLLLGAVHHGRLGLERLVEMCCEAPARIFGLEGKGVIEKGADADLVLFSEGETTKLDAGDLRSRAGWSPYVGREIGAYPDLVVVGGRIVARDGVLADDLQPAAPVRYRR